MRKNTLYQLGRAILFSITLFAFLALAPGGSFVAKALDEPEMPPNDARVLPATVKARGSMVELFFAAAPDSSYAPGYYDTSVYMLGDVAVGIVLPESTGNGEDWTVAEQNNVIDGIQDGLNWWKTTGGELADLTFQYDIQLDVPTSYEPITLSPLIDPPSGPSDEELLIDQVMSNLGYTTGDYFEKVYAYNNDLRDQYQTDWAFTIFVVASSKEDVGIDTDGKFADGSFAYAYIGGPFMVMTYDNGGWGADYMDDITAHEAGHIFWASDQYAASGCNTTKPYGYLGVVTSNCENGGVGLPAIMNDNTRFVDASTRGQIGWRDSDSDDKPDPVDTTPSISLAQYAPDPTRSTTLSYSGYVKDVPYPHAACGFPCVGKAVTIQAIEEVSYRVDNGTWNAATPSDGTFDTDLEDFSLTTTTLTPATHTIDVQSSNQIGNTSTVWSDSVTVNAPAASVGAGIYDDTDGEFTYTGSWAPYSGAGPYNNTMQYSTTVGNEITFSIDGQMFEVIYTGNPNRGTVNVYVDGGIVGTLNEYNAVLAWQSVWTSPVLSAGVHTVKLVHAGGAVVDFDAVEVFATPPPPPTPLGAGKYDDTNGNLEYTGSWGSYSGVGPYDDTMQYSVAAGNDVAFSIDGQVFKVNYTGNPNRGTVDVYVDDVKVDTINEYAAVLSWQSIWVSPVLSAGVHNVKLVHASGAVVDFDAVEVFTTPPPPPTLEAGMYDDTNEALVYDGTWDIYSGAGPYNNGVHYSTTPGNFVTFSMDGEQFRITYTGNSNRGTVDIYIDDVKVDTLDEYSATTVWQNTWTSPVLFDGLHTVKLVHISGAVVDLDAVEVVIVPPTLGEGIYDDSSDSLVYTGVWEIYSDTGPYNDTLHYSTAVGNSVTFSMVGVQFRLIYTGNPGRGTVDVYVDDVKVDTLNEYNATATWQSTWSSPALSPGIHIVRLVHASGAVVDLDAIEIVIPRPPENDDFANALDITELPYSHEIADVSLATTEANDPQLTACGSDEGKFSVWYKIVPGSSGILYVDTLESGYDTVVGVWKGTYPNLNLVACNDDSSPTVFQSELAGAVDQGVTYYIEAIQFTEVGASSQRNDVSAAPGPGTLVLKAQLIPGLGLGMYDDANPAFLYSGSWLPYSGAAYYAGTLHYSTTIGNSATFGFTGEYFELMYTGNPNRGTLDVYIDGAIVGTLDEYSATAAAQQTWASPTLSNGAHLVKLVHAGGAIVDIDAVEITTPPPPPAPLAAGKYDDTNLMLAYTGTWGAYAGAGPYTDTLQYSTALGSDVTFAIDGQMFIITYTGNANRGNMDVYVDDVKVGTIAAYSATLFWQKTWSSPALSAGVHTVKLVHASGAVVDIDAVEVLATPLTIYDDAAAEFTYTGSWIPYVGAGPYNGTLHYSDTTGSYVTFSVDGQFTIIYTGNSNRGTVDVYVDDVKIDTINEYSATTVWQKTWTSPVLSAGVHNVKLVHVSGAIVDLDAVEIN